MRRCPQFELRGLALLGLVLVMTGTSQAVQPSHAEAAQQVAAEAGVSPDEVEVISVTFAGTEVRGNEIIEKWHIQYNLKPKAGRLVPETPADAPRGLESSIMPFLSGESARDSEWGETGRNAPISSAENDSFVWPTGLPIRSSDDRQSIVIPAIGICILVFAGLGVVVAWQIARACGARTNRAPAQPPPIPTDSETACPN